MSTPGSERFGAPKRGAAGALLRVLWGAGAVGGLHLPNNCHLEKQRGHGWGHRQAPNHPPCRHPTWAEKGLGVWLKLPGLDLPLTAPVSSPAPPLTPARLPRPFLPRGRAAE